MKVTNISTADQAFNVKGGDTVVLAPGESKNIALSDPDSVQNQGRRQAGIVIFGAVEEPEKVARQVERSAVAKQD